MRSLQKQFTLIELLVTMFIIGAILSLTFTALDDLTGSSRLAATARQLGDYISLARNEAAAQGKVIEIHYDLVEKKYWMQLSAEAELEGSLPLDSSEQDDNPYAMTAISLKAGVTFEDIMLSQEVVKTSGKMVIRFSPFGFSAGHIVHLQSDDKQEISVEINGLTGIPSYYDFYKKFDQIVIYEDTD
ncbi:MAG: prepilin-type N-terminal cleavage/methylation domain-containing protein [Planctomycetota bacterium]